MIKLISGGDRAPAARAVRPQRGSQIAAVHQGTKHGWQLRPRWACDTGTCVERRCQSVAGRHRRARGKNGSGKSTILDMAQVVLTGRQPALSAPETRCGRYRKVPAAAPKRSRRRLLPGQPLARTRRRRDEARTYVGATALRTTDGIRRARSTIGMALEARKISDSKENRARAVRLRSAANPDLEGVIEQRGTGQLPRAVGGMPATGSWQAVGDAEFRPITRRHSAGGTTSASTCVTCCRTRPYGEAGTPARCRSPS
jgi:hypothetical protein